MLETFFPDTDDGPLVEISERTNEIGVSGYFTVAAPWSENRPLLVSFNLSFSDSIRSAVDADTRELIIYQGTDPEEEFNWQKGYVTIEAEDSSFLIIEAVAGQPNNFLLSTGDDGFVGPVFAEIKR